MPLPEPLPIWDAMLYIEQDAYRKWRMQKAPSMDLETAATSLLAEVTFMIARNSTGQVLVTVLFTSRKVGKGSEFMYSLQRATKNRFVIDPVE